MALLFGLLFKRSGIAIGVYFLYAVVIENALAGLLNHYAGGIGAYLPLETTDNLIPFPIMKQMVKQVVTHRSTAVLLTVSLAYLCLYFLHAKESLKRMIYKKVLRLTII